MLWCFLPGKGRPSSPSWGKNDISSGHALGTNGQSFDLTCRWAKKKTFLQIKRCPFAAREALLTRTLGNYIGNKTSSLFRGATHP